MFIITNFLKSILLEIRFNPKMTNLAQKMANKAAQPICFPLLNNNNNVGHDETNKRKIYEQILLGHSNSN